MDDKQSQGESMTRAIITIQAAAVSAAGAELLAKARRIARALVESLDTVDRAMQDVHFLLLTTADGHARFVQTVPDVMGVERILNAVEGATARAYCVVACAPAEGNGACILFHLQEPNGHAAVHISELAMTPDGPTIDATTILQPGQTVALPYSVASATHRAPPGGARLH